MIYYNLVQYITVQYVKCSVTLQAHPKIIQYNSMWYLFTSHISHS